MSTVPSGTRFIGISERVNLTERKSAGLNSETQPYTIDDLVDTIGVGAEGPQGVQGPAGPPGPVGPAGLEWQGAWVSGTSYVANDAVGYGGASYFCILATSGTTTPNLATANWALLASQGAIGPQGAQGPTGPQGAGATQTLQQTVGLGNTVDDGEGPILTVTAESVKVQDFLGGRIKMEYTTGNKPFVEFGVPSSGGLRTTLTTPNVQTANRTITLPDASGTIALTSDVTLQKAIDGGNTITSGGITTTLTNESIVLGGSSTSGITLGGRQITCRRGAGSQFMTLQFPSTLSTVRLIDFPNASGTVALTTDVTLQKAIDGGNTITSGGFTTKLTNTYIKVGESSDSGMTLNTSQILFEKSGGTELMILQFPPALSGIKQITLPNATGTVALQSAASGTFTSQDGKTITVTNGVITSIV